jgi:Mn-containing catalase
VRARSERAPLSSGERAVIAAVVLAALPALGLRSPGADKYLLALIEATAAMEMADIHATLGRLS